MGKITKAFVVRIPAGILDLFDRRRIKDGFRTRNKAFIRWTEAYAKGQVDMPPKPKEKENRK